MDDIKQEVLALLQRPETMVAWIVIQSAVIALAVIY